MRALLLLLIVGGAACSIEPIDLADRECDDDHPCAAEYTCVEGICERTDEIDDADESEDASADE